MSKTTTTTMKAGDVVRLAIGPEMLVIDTKDGRPICAWFTSDNTWQTATLHWELLTKVEPKH